MDLNPALYLLVLTEAFYWGGGGPSVPPPKMDSPNGYNLAKKGMNRGAVGTKPKEGAPRGVKPRKPGKVPSPLILPLLLEASRNLPPPPHPLPHPSHAALPARPTAEGRSPPELFAVLK